MGHKWLWRWSIFWNMNLNSLRVVAFLSIKESTALCGRETTTLVKNNIFWRH
jgi:hypothetical protein